MYSGITIGILASVIDYCVLGLVTEESEIRRWSL